MSSPESRRKEWLKGLGLLDPGAWCQFPYALTCLGSDEAILLSVLISQLAHEVAAEKDDDLWMRMSNRRILSKLQGWRNWKVKKILTSIYKLDLLDVDVRGTPKNRQRWVRIDPLRLHAVLAARGVGAVQYPGSCSAPTPRHETAPIKKRSSGERALRGAAPSPSKTIRVKSLRYAPYREFAQRLHDMVQSVRKVNSTSKPSTWAQSFRTLHKRGAPIERIEEVLKWYGAMLKKLGDLMRAGTTYIPIAYTGPKWLDKWESLELAMERDRHREGEEGPKIRPKLRIVRHSTRKVDEWGFEVA